MFEIKNLHKSFNGGAKKVGVLSGLDFSCGAGEFVGIFGASGSGKSTFLHVVGGLDRPDEGSVIYGGEDIFRKGEKFLANYRNREIGFVFQFYHLLPEFSAVENVMLPCLISGMGGGESRERAEWALDLAGISVRGRHRPSELSGGEQQRVAIARAIVMRPKFILADEPTGNLDEETGIRVFEGLVDLSVKENMGVIMVTHNPDLLKRIPRRLELKSGTLHEKAN